MYYPVVNARVEPAMNTATIALGGILASIAIPRSAGSRRHEARPNAGQGSPEAPRSGALWRLPARWRRGRKQENWATMNTRVLP
jgi:hypothetical protein